MMISPAAAVCHQAGERMNYFSMHQAMLVSGSSDGAGVGSHALLGPALPVEVAVEHPLPAVIRQGGAAMNCGGGANATRSLPPLGMLVSDRKNIFAAA